MLHRIRKHAFHAGFILLILAGLFSSALAESQYGITTSDKVRFRKEASTSAETWFKLPKDYVCTFTGTLEMEGITWYRVETTNPNSVGSGNVYAGYVHGNFFRPLTENEAGAFSSNAVPQTGTESYGPQGSSGTAVSGDPYGSSPSSYTAPGFDATTATGQIAHGGVNVRAEASTASASLLKLDKGEIVRLLSVPLDSDPDPWYQVRYGNVTGYVQGPFLRILSYGTLRQTSPASGTGSPTPAETQTSGGSQTTPETQTNSGTQAAVSSGTSSSIIASVRLRLTSAHLRMSPGGSVWTDWEEQGGTLPVYGDPVKSGKYTWYPVVYKRRTLYVRGDCVDVIYADGSTGQTGTQTGTQTDTQAGTQTGTQTDTSAAPSSQAGTAMGYIKTIKSGINVRSTPGGSKVLGRVNSGQILPYTKKTVSGKYTWYLCSTSVGTGYLRSDCVKEVQQDGSASAAASSSSGTSSGAITVSGMTLYPAEKIDWYDGGIQELIPKGSNFQVYDVKTGIVWTAHRWSGGGHADIEPLTAADTAKLCKIYGVSSAKQITSSKHYARRPCLITVGGRTFACSLYGVPHNEGEGDTIKNNNMEGQVCLHFTNSRTSGTKVVDSGHQSAIEYAWKNSPSGHK